MRQAFGRPQQGTFGVNFGVDFGFSPKLAFGYETSVAQFQLWHPTMSFRLAGGCRQYGPIEDYCKVPSSQSNLSGVLSIAHGDVRSTVSPDSLYEEALGSFFLITAFMLKSDEGFGVLRYSSF